MTFASTADDLYLLTLEQRIVFLPVAKNDCFYAVSLILNENTRKNEGVAILKYFFYLV